MPTVRELAPADAPELTALYEEYEWWEDRTVEDVEAALDHTELALGVELDDQVAAERTGDLVAATRVLTDYQYYANLFDLVVAADHRGEGLGASLLEAVLDHPDLQSTPGVSLLCREGLVPFYETVGFELFEPEFEVPEGGTEELVRMTYAFD